MPRGDGTGPVGMGSMTGRGAGFCANFAVPGYLNPVGRPFGCGRGFRRMYYATGIPGRAHFGYANYTGAYESLADEKEVLSKQAEFLENQLHKIKERISSFTESD